MKNTIERVTRKTENYMYDWIDASKRAKSETHLPVEIVRALRATKTVGEWHRLCSRVSSEIWDGASSAEIDAAITQCERNLQKLAKER